MGCGRGEGTPELPAANDHLLIAGTGRAGTSLLVRALHACGLETEITQRGRDAFWDSNANAGLESIPLLGNDNPYVVKSPWSYQFMRQLLADPNPARRRYHPSPESRRGSCKPRYFRAVPSLPIRRHESFGGRLAGSRRRGRGRTYSLEPLDQARILAYSFHRMIEMLLEHDLPMHFIKFPRFVRDIEYLHRCLAPVLPHAMPFSEFSIRMASVIDEGKVRVTGELTEASSHTAKPPGGTAPLHDAAELPSFSALNEFALKRELRSARSALDALQAEYHRVIAQRDLLASQMESIKGTDDVQ